VLFSLTPILAPDSLANLAAARVEAEGNVEKAKVQAAAAKVTFDRAQLLLGDRAGSQRSADEARAALALAEVTLKAAEAKRDVLARAVTSLEGGGVTPIPLPAPLDGVLWDLRTAAGQTVAAGTPLFEVHSLLRLWVRVPVYVGDAAKFVQGADAQVMGRAAKLVLAPPRGDAAAATVDFVYEVDNADGTLRPGQRVEAILPLREEEDALVAPWAAVVHDAYGGSWVYERTAERTFARRRVEVRRVVGREAVLRTDLKPGAPVVSAGAAELFGREFFVTK
jgi:RND family efflux transporter MFP subunit